MLAKGRTRLTAFVPTDRAFRRLVRSLTGNLPRTEKATFRAVATVADVDTLEAILLYHVVPGSHDHVHRRRGRRRRRAHHRTGRQRAGERAEGTAASSCGTRTGTPATRR